jgi:hypothetical protein
LLAIERLNPHPSHETKARHPEKLGVYFGGVEGLATRLWVTKIILPLAGVLVGTLGALTGLVAVLLHKK